MAYEVHDLCPKCGGEIYDNRDDKESGNKSSRWPDEKCKDQDCGWAWWDDKGEGNNRGGSSGRPRGNRGRGRGRGGPPPKREPKWTWESLAKTYRRCLVLAEWAVLGAEKRAKEGNAPKVAYLASDVTAIAATLFIAAGNGGVREKAAVGEPEGKPEAAPARSTASAETEEDDDLPF